VWLRRYGEALEADLHRFYGLDLLDFYRGKMSPRALWVRLWNLPPESAVARTVMLESGDAQPRQEPAAQQSSNGHAAPRYLEDIPVAGSLSEAMQFTESSGDEFTNRFANAR
jgi:hypothetical protein